MKTRHNILLIEDDGLVAKSMEVLLRVNDFAVTMAGSGEEAMEILSGSGAQGCPDGFDLILTDLKMKGIDGIAFLDKLNLVIGQTPVIVLSGLISESTRREANTRGIFRFLMKPCDDVHLLDTIKECLAAQG